MGQEKEAVKVRVVLEVMGQETVVVVLGVLVLVAQGQEQDQARDRHSR